MKRKKKFEIFSFLCGILLLMPILVDARSSLNDEICINSDSGSNFYTVTRKGKNVVPFYITDDDIKGTDQYPEKCFCSTVGDVCLVENRNRKQCAPAYQFEVQSQGQSCKIQSSTEDSYEFFLCPDQNSANVVSDMQKGMSVNEYISSTNQYKVKFDVPAKFRGKVYAQLIRKTVRNGVSVFDIDSQDGLPNSPSSIVRTYSPSEVENGIYFTPGTEFYFIFYLSDSGDACNNSRLGYIMGAVPSNVPNPMYNDPICTNFRSQYASGSVERIMVSDCDSEKIQYHELSTIRNKILSKIEEVERIHSQISNTVSPTNNFTCLFENNSTTINTQSGFSTKVDFLEVAGAGTYWKALCTETISIEYDDPQATKAGGGFGYNAKVVINRTCTPVKIAEPKYLPTCRYSVECWGGPANHTGESGAGPNEDFDQCINTCDGGTYTQDCIHSCYNKIYGKSLTYSANHTKLTTSTFLDSGKETYSIARLSTNKGNPDLIGTTGGGITNLPISSGCVISGNNIDNGCGTSCGDNSWCKSEHGVTFTYLNGCNANGETEGTRCYEVYTNWPCDDGNNYKKDILESEAEYNAVVAAIQEFSSTAIENEEYQMIIEEEYNKQTNGTYSNRTTTFSNKNGDHSIAVNTSSENLGSTFQSNTNIADPTVGNLDDAFIREHVQKDIYSYQLSRTIEVGVGAAYVSKIDGNDVVYNDKTTPTDPELDNNPKYFSAQNKYFTRFDTKLVNNYLNWPYYNNAVTSDSTDAYTKNIHVRFYNIGSWNQWGTSGNGVNVDCLYGVAPGIVNTGCTPGDDDCPYLEDEGTGIRYIFRPINLGDMFPNNRDPRFNWTGTVNKSTNTSSGAALTADESLYNDAVDPETLIEFIQAKNESIYDVTTDSSEVDYEFVLTTENIRNIRKYNKNVKDYNGDGERNYLDYNMSCYTNARGQEICTSRFLDNINGNSGDESYDEFITYSVSGYGIDARKSIAGCNNAINGTSCYTVSR